MAVVALSRPQFARPTLYHVLFVPLTLGLSFILAIMESVYGLAEGVAILDRIWQEFPSDPAADKTMHD